MRHVSNQAGTQPRVRKSAGASPNSRASDAPDGAVLRPRVWGWRDSNLRIVAVPAEDDFRRHVDGRAHPRLC